VTDEFLNPTKPGETGSAADPVDELNLRTLTEFLNPTRYLLCSLNPISSSVERPS
jgi:hypothetical protein